MPGFPTWHCVYFIQIGELVKIGWTQAPDHRAKQLRGRLLGYIASTDNCGQHCRHERAVHEQWAHLRERGELFRATPELLAWILKSTC